MNGGRAEQASGYLNWMARLFLIDGSNQMYRAYHAIRGLTGPDGKSTNAVYGFVTMLKKPPPQPAAVAVSATSAAAHRRLNIVRMI